MHCCQLECGVQVTDAMLLLASPYPTSGSVVVINQTSQLVDATLRPVPLSEVYVHHWGSSGKFVQGSGAELRGARDRAPVRVSFAASVSCFGIAVSLSSAWNSRVNGIDITVLAEFFGR